MTPEDFDRLQALMASRAGYTLLSERMQLAEHRLGPIARREGYHNVEALLNHLWSRPLGALGWQIIECLLNGETWFRRDRHVFELYARELLPALGSARKDRPVRILCAGGGSGQEAYSLAMAALDLGIKVEILSTDLSASNTTKGTTGVYSGFEIQRGLSAQSMLKWFGPVEEQWQASADLRRCVHFERANLLDPPSESALKRGPFDLIFCRYVLEDMIPDKRSLVLDQLCDQLMDDGCLFLGLSDKIEGKAFRQVAGQTGLFVKSPERSRHAA